MGNNIDVMSVPSVYQPRIPSCYSRRYEYNVVPNIQALSSVLVNSHTVLMMMMVMINMFHNDHEDGISSKYTRICTRPLNAVLLLVGLILYCILATKTD